MITAIVIGLGDRGKTYSNFAFESSNQFKIIAGADPNTEALNSFGNSHGLQSSMRFSSWEELLNKDKIADVAIITTPDHLHFDPTIKALQKGYDVLLEKPMAPTIYQCKELNEIARETQRILQICHVLRYSSFYQKINETIKSGKIGNVVNITMMENVSYYHYAHSYIRGSWNNREKSSPMILAKCSHDLDLMYWFAGSLPNKISSFGGLNHFVNPSKDLPERCTDGCAISDECLYYAPRIYQDIVPLLHVTRKSGDPIERSIARIALKYPGLKKYPPFSRINEYGGWPVSVITPGTSQEDKRAALENGPYGRCVYKIFDHNVVDHQVVSIMFQNNITATLTMHGHSSEEGRYIRIDGTKGTLIGKFLYSGEHLELIDSLTNEKSILHSFTGLSVDHGGSDEKIIEDFIELVKKRKRGEKVKGSTNSEVSLISHMMAFAADEARIQHSIINFKSFLAQESK